MLRDVCAGAIPSGAESALRTQTQGCVAPPAARIPHTPEIQIHHDRRRSDHGSGKSHRNPCGTEVLLREMAPGRYHVKLTVAGDDVPTSGHSAEFSVYCAGPGVVR